MEDKLILLVEDNPHIMAINDAALHMRGYRTLQAETAHKCRELLCFHAVDLIVLDILLPDGDGVALCREIKQEYDVPILFLTAMGENEDIVKGLTAGGDDYLTKPFGVMELISRLKALLRRSMNMDESKVLSIGEITIDNEKHKVSVQGQPCELTYKEFELLKLMLQNVGIVLSRDVIMERVWGVDFEGESRTLDMHIKTLRQKLGESGKRIKTVRNVGYRLE